VWIALGLCLATAVAPAGARAETRTATLGDAQDVTTANTPDIEQMSSAIDTDSGQTTVRVRFYAPLPSPVPSSASTVSWRFGRAAGDPPALCSTSSPGSVTVRASLSSSNATASTLTPSFSTTTEPATFALSADRREVTVTLTSASMQALNPNCLGGALSSSTSTTTDSVADSYMDGQWPPPQAPLSEDSRVGSLDDPRDQKEALSGPNRPDTRQVRVTYDQPSGRIYVTLAYWEANARSGTLENFTLGWVAYDSNGTARCDASRPGGVTASFTNMLSVAGYDGKLTPVAWTSPDGFERTFAYENAKLANRGYECFVVNGNPYSSISPSFDDIAGIGYFPGFTPPACTNKVDDDGDGLIDEKDPGCRGSRQNGTETDPAPVASQLGIVAKQKRCDLLLTPTTGPALTPTELFPLAATVKVTIRGKTKSLRKFVRRREIAAAGSTRITVFPVGTYTVTASYPGDRFRRATTASASATVTRAGCPPPKPSKPVKAPPLPKLGKKDGLSWNSSKKGWTVVLLSTTSKSEATQLAKRLRKRKFLAGILSTDRFKNLGSGLWMVWAGRFSSEDLAYAAASSYSRLGYDGEAVEYIRARGLDSGSDTTTTTPTTDGG
jgi:hypothetical protein